MNKLISSIIGILIAIFLLMASGGKEFKDTSKDLEPLRVDELMPPNERVYMYIETYSKKYKVPIEYVLRCARAESSYKGLTHITYAPYADWLVSSANAYSVLQVRVVAARDVWRQFGYKSEFKYFTDRQFSPKWFKERERAFKYRLRYGIPMNTKLEFKTDTELAYILRFDLRFNVETGIKYMRFLRDDRGYSWVQMYSVYNQGWKGAHYINAYARYITRVKINEEET